MTTIQKFNEITVTTNEKIIVLVDEAHRYQFGASAGAMDQAIPNGIYFGFTGTPIDKKNKSVFRVFGDLVDKYGFEESKADGATIPIQYVGMLPNLFVEGNESIDALFDRIIALEPGMTPEAERTAKAGICHERKDCGSPPKDKKNCVGHRKSLYKPCTGQRIQGNDSDILKRVCSVIQA